MTDQFAGHKIARHEITRHEIAGHENDGPKMMAARKIIAMSGPLKCAHLATSAFFARVVVDLSSNDETAIVGRVEPQTFAASDPLSYPALLCPAISCPAISCPANWSVNFTSVIFTSSIFSALI